MDIMSYAKIAHNTTIGHMFLGKKSFNWEPLDKISRAALAIFPFIGFPSARAVETWKTLKDTSSTAGYGDKVKALEYDEEDPTYIKVGIFAAFANSALSVSVLMKRLDLFDLGKFCTNTFGGTRIFGAVANVGLGQVKTACVVVYLCTLLVNVAGSNSITYADSAMFAHLVFAFEFIGLEVQCDAGKTQAKCGVSEETARIIDFTDYVILCGKIATATIGGIFLYSSGTMLAATAVVMTSDLAIYFVKQILIESKDFRNAVQT